MAPVEVATLPAVHSDVMLVPSERATVASGPIHHETQQPVASEAESSNPDVPSLQQTKRSGMTMSSKRTAAGRRSGFQFLGVSRVLSSKRPLEGEQHGLKSTLHSGPQGAHLIERNCNEEVLSIMRADTANSACADCSAPLGTDAWAAINHGIFLCIRCCGVHRSLGTHISQCRSVDLDDWTTDQVANMKGNRASNAILEAHLPRGYKTPSCLDPVAVCADFIQAKYVRKEFIKAPTTEHTLSSYNIFDRRVSVMLRCRGRMAHASIEEGVLVCDVPGWSGGSFFVALDPSHECGPSASSSSSLAGPQDRPIDSRFVQVLGLKREVLVKFELANFAEVVLWLKALRGSAALADRSTIKQGWLTLLASSGFKRLKKRWLVLHASGLYFFKRETSGNYLPEIGLSSGDWRDVIKKPSVQGIDWGHTKEDYWIHIKCQGHSKHFQIAAPEEGIRDAWLQELFNWVGWQCRPSSSGSASLGSPLPMPLEPSDTSTTTTTTTTSNANPVGSPFTSQTPKKSPTETE